MADIRNDWLRNGLVRLFLLGCLTGMAGCGADRGASSDWHSVKRDNYGNAVLNYPTDSPSDSAGQ